MRTYKVLKNGFQLSIARGKNKAIEHIKRDLSYDGLLHIATWKKIGGNIICSVNNGNIESVYTLEEDRNE